MPKQLMLSVMIDLPGDLFQDAAVATSIQSGWQSMLDGLANCNIVHDASAEYIEAKRGPAPKKPQRRATGTRIQPVAPATSWLTRGITDMAPETVGETQT
jgi:hypothetical protein